MNTQRHDREAPAGQRMIQIVLAIIVCFHIIAFTLPSAKAAVAKDLGPNAYGQQPLSSTPSGEQILFKGATLAFKDRKFNQARRVLEYTSRMGHSPSKFALSNLYQYGLGVKINYRTALNLKASAATDGLPAAQFQLGSAYFSIGSVPAAIKWWTRAANTGFRPAQYNLGLVYLYGLGISKDTNEAEDWLMRAASKGSARAQFYVGVMYLKGEGVSEDRALAQQWMKKSAENGFKGATVDLDSLAERPVQPMLAK